MEILPYSCHDLGFLLQDFQCSLIDLAKILKKFAAHNSPFCKTGATVWGSYEENASCMFQNTLGMLVGTAPRFQQRLSYVN